MSLTELLPDIHTLSRLDKIRLIQILARDIECDEAELIEAGRSYAVWSPDRAYTAAAVMLDALDEDRQQP
jgi:hypothetical protein